MEFNNLIKKNKKIILIISFIIIIILLIIFGIYKFLSYYFQDNVRFEREYEKLNEEITSDGRKYPFVDISTDNVIKYLDFDEISNIIKKKDDSVIYFGNAKCLYCRTVVQVLLDVSEDTEIDEIYYVEVDNKNSKIDKLFDIFGEKFIGDNKKIDIPLVLFVVDGRVVSFKVGTFVSHNDPYKKLNETQLSALTNIYITGINDVIAGMQN